MVTPDQQQVRRLVLQQLKSLSHAGLMDLPRVTSRRTEKQAEVATPSPSNRTPASPATTSSRGKVEEKSVAEPRPPTRTKEQPRSESLERSGIAWSGPSLPPRERVAALGSLRERVASCTRCRELAQNRTQTVFGVGNPMARLAFLGEAPGADEDRQGEPFVGRAGQLLTKIIEACTLRREDVYILNILKCRPPGNRNPQPAEAENCGEYLREQLQIIRPEFICCLGTVAAQNLLDTTESIGKLRGKVHTWGEIPVIATYHPAYLLRNPNAKRAAWEDMKFLMHHMGIELPPR
ncbi:MAG: uracil-DNA glycosylase family protein [Planctomycetota bacterium]